MLALTLNYKCFNVDHRRKWPVPWPPWEWTTSRSKSRPSRTPPIHCCRRGERKLTWLLKVRRPAAEDSVGLKCVHLSAGSKGYNKEAIICFRKWWRLKGVWKMKTDFNLLFYWYVFPQFSKELFLLLSLCNYLTTLCHEKLFRHLDSQKLMYSWNSCKVYSCSILLQLVFPHNSFTVTCLLVDCKREGMSRFFCLPAEDIGTLFTCTPRHWYLISY